MKMAYDISLFHQTNVTPVGITGGTNHTFLYVLILLIKKSAVKDYFILR